MTSVAAYAEPITLEVFGIPQPQGSKSAIVRNNRAVIVESNNDKSRAAFKDWRAAVSQAARDWQAIHNAPLLDEPVALTVTFRLPRPPSLPKRRVWPDRRPDASKLLRAVEDSLTGIIIADDSRICDVRVIKRYAADTPPGCTITIELLT